MIRAAPSPPVIDLEGVLQRYDGFLIDAYGVLLDSGGALPGARLLLERLEREGRPWLLLTNSASRLPETMSEEFADFGLAIPPERILSSGALLADHFHGHGLEGCPCLVLGPDDACRYVERAGGVVVDKEGDAAVLVLADQKGFDCMEGMNRALGLVLRRLDAGGRIELLLSNPDLIYPLGPGSYGLTAGALAAMLEAVLQERYGPAAPRFVRLGKPFPPLFHAGLRRLGATRPVMLGDQLATDIRGANGCGIASVLVGTGLAAGFIGAGEDQPTWYLRGLD